MKVAEETGRVSLRQVVMWVQLAVMMGAPALAYAQGITLPDEPKNLLAEIAGYVIACAGAFVTICFGIFGGKFASGRAHWTEGIPAAVGGAIMVAAGLFIAA
jgi:hypothetical protein